MKSFINIIRTLFSIPLYLLAFLLLVISPILITLFTTVKNPSNLKLWLNNSGIYNDVVDLAIDQVVAKAGEGSIEKGFSITEEESRTTIKEILEPEWLRLQSETVIDATYTWAKGDSPRPQFILDFSDRKDKVGNALQKLVHAKVANLPVCDNTVNEAAEFDPFKAECIPAEIDRDTALLEADKKVDQLINHEKFLADSKFDSKNLEINKDVEKKVPQFYRIGEVSIFAIPIAIIFLLSLSSIILPWRKIGVYISGAIVILAGIINLLLSFSSQFLFENINKLLYKSVLKELTKEELDLIDRVMNQFLKSIVDTLSSNLKSFSLTIIVFGFLTITTTFLYYYYRNEEKKNLQ